MKCRKVTLLVAVMLAMLTMAVAPAFANDKDLDCKNRPGPFIRCDGDRFVDVDRTDNLFGHRTNHGFDCFGCGSNRFHNNFAFSPYAFSPYAYGCWEWDGDEWEWDCD